MPWVLHGSQNKVFALCLKNPHHFEAELWHTCLGHYPLQKLCFLVWSDMNSGCYGNLKFP